VNRKQRKKKKATFKDLAIQAIEI